MEARTKGRAEAALVARLPAFLVLGAQKAGTTSLDAWLRAQRGLELPTPKETHFFSDDERHAKGAEWYLARFGRGVDAAPSRVRGEVDPDYLSDPRVPARVAGLYGAAHARLRLVAVLREPLARAHSQWRMSRRRGIEARPFAEALRESWRLGERAGGDHDYLARGRYAQHLARFRAELPEAPLLVLTFDELTDPARRAAAFARVCAFVGLAGAPEAPDFETALNRGGRARSALLQRVLQRQGSQRMSGLRRALGRLVPSQDLRLSIGVALERANTAPAADDEPLAGPLPAEALAAVRADLAELERAHGAALGADLAAWRARIDELGGGA